MNNQNHPIEYIQITVKPWAYPDTESRLLKVEVQVNGSIFYHEQVLFPNEFESAFDRIMDYAKHQIKEAVQAYDKKIAGDGTTVAGHSEANKKFKEKF